MKKIITIIFTFIASISLAACNGSSTNMFYFELDASFDGYVTMVTEAGYPPYENLVKKDGKWTIEGVDIEIGKEIARALKKNLRVIDKNFDFLITDVQTGKADFAIAGITPTSKRLEQVDFSNSYFTEENTQLVLINATNKDIYKTLDDINKSSIAVGAQKGSLQEILLDELTPNATKRVNPDLNFLLQELSTGKIQALFTETAVADTHINGEFKDLYKAFTVNSDYSGNAIAVKKGYANLELINNVIKTLKDEGKIDKWVAQYSEGN